MANEKRLIDANAYPCSTCDISYCYKNCDKFNAWFEKTVDAVEVRCKDCEFCVYNSSNDTYKCRSMNGMYRTVKPDDFCSYGERRTE